MVSCRCQVAGSSASGNRKGALVFTYWFTSYMRPPLDVNFLEESFQAFNPEGAVGKRPPTAPSSAQGRRLHPGCSRQWCLCRLEQKVRCFATRSHSCDHSCCGSLPCLALGSVLGAFSASRPVRGPLAPQAHGVPLVSRSHHSHCQPWSSSETRISSLLRSRFHSPLLSFWE